MHIKHEHYKTRTLLIAVENINKWRGINYDFKAISMKSYDFLSIELAISFRKL